MPEPATARVIRPRFKVSTTGFVAVKVVREPPGRSVVEAKAWVLVPLSLPLKFRMPPPSSNVLTLLMMALGVIVRLLKLRLSVPPRTVVLPV